MNNATLSVTLNYLATPGAKFVIVTNATGQFAGLPEGALIPAGPMRLRVSYVGGDGHDVELTAELPSTPEPPTPPGPPNPPGPPGQPGQPGQPGHRDSQGSLVNQVSPALQDSRDRIRRR